MKKALLIIIFSCLPLLGFPGGETDFMDMEESATISTPDSGYGRLQGKTDNKIYYKTSGGVEYDLTKYLTQEEVDDYVSELINDADSAHTRVTITYDDTDNAYDFVVDDMVNTVTGDDTNSTSGKSITLSGGTGIETSVSGDTVTVTNTNPANTDDQTIDVFSISGNNVQLSLEDDGEATKTVDISTTTAVTANTAKVTNATHTGEVTGATVLTIADSVTVTGWTMGASGATTPIADDNDTSLATTAFCETTQNYLKTSELAGAETDPNVDTADKIEAILTNDPMDFGTGTVTSAGGFVGNVTGNASGSSGSCTGNAATATALAANGANAGAGQAILGVDASGAAEGAFDVWTEAENTAAGYISATLTQEESEDYAGGMVANATGTHTRVAVTYQDATGDMDIVVDDMNDDVPEAGDFGAATDLDANGALVANAVDSAEYTDASIDHEHLAPDAISGMTDVTSADADYIMLWDATDSTLKKCDMGEVRGSGGAPTDGEYVTTTSNATLTAETALNNLTSGLTMQNPTDAASNHVLNISGGNRTTPADDDEVYFSFKLDDDNGAQQEYARITGIAEDVTNTTKDGGITLDTMINNSLTEVFRIHQKGIISYPKQSSFKVQLTSAQTIPTNTFTVAILNNEIWDKQNEFNTATYKFTATEDGLYTAVLSTYWYPATVGKTYNIYICVNGAYTYSFSRTATHTTYTYLVINTVIDLDTNDYVEIRVYQNSGSDQDLYNASFIMCKVG